MVTPTTAHLSLPFLLYSCPSLLAFASLSTQVMGLSPLLAPAGITSLCSLVWVVSLYFHTCLELLFGEAWDQVGS